MKEKPTIINVFLVDGKEINVKDLTPEEQARFRETMNCRALECIGMQEDKSAS